MIFALLLLFACFFVPLLALVLFGLSFSKREWRIAVVSVAALLCCLAVLCYPYSMFLVLPQLHQIHTHFVLFPTQTIIICLVIGLGGIGFGALGSEWRKLIPSKKPIGAHVPHASISRKRLALELISWVIGLTAIIQLCIAVITPYGCILIQ